MKKLKICELKGVRKTVVSVPPTSRLTEVARAMLFEDIGAIVVASEDRPIVGIITERDIVRAIGQGGPDAVNLTAADAMQSATTTCSPDDRVTDVMQSLLRRRIRHLPLIDHGQLVGMVSIGDVMKGLLGLMQLEANVLRDMYFTASTR